MNKKVILIAVGALLVLGGVYKFVLAAPAPTNKVKPNVEGVILPLDKEFLVNLDGGQFAKVQIALLLSEKDPAAALAETAEAGPPPLHPQNAVIRSVITNELTGLQPSDLLDKVKQKEVLERIAKRLGKETDAKILEVKITDLNVA